MTHGYQSRFDQNLWQWFRNDNAGTVPQFAVMRITGIITQFGRPVITIDQPDTSSSQCYLINGPSAVASGGRGQGTYGPAVVVRYTGADPAAGLPGGLRASPG